MIANQKPYKMICPKCNFSKFYPRGSVGDAQVYHKLAHCPKCKELLEEKQEVNVLEEFLGNLSYWFKKGK